jgi:hypothetical protein
MPKLTLTITLEEDNRVSVDGPLDNRILCYGLLKMAEEALYEYGKNSQKRIQPAGVMPPHFNKFGGS